MTTEAEWVQTMAEHVTATALSHSPALQAKGGLKTPQGIASDGTDIWIVDTNSDKVLRYSGAASRTAGNQGASSSFALTAGNPTGITTDGSTIWVVDSSTDRVYKYSTAVNVVLCYGTDGIDCPEPGIQSDVNKSGPSAGVVDIDDIVTVVLKFGPCPSI